MKKIIAVCLLAVPAIGFAQMGNFSIKGNVGLFNAPAKIYLTYKIAGNDIKDSVILNKGNFSFKGKIADPVQGGLTLQRQGGPMIDEESDESTDKLTFYLEKGTIVITGKDSISTAGVSGSITNNYYNKYEESLSDVFVKRKKIEAEFHAASPATWSTPAFLNDRHKKVADAAAEERQRSLNFIKSNHNTIVSLDLLQIYGGPIPELDIIEPLFNSLSPEVRNTSKGREYAAIIRNIKKTAIGSMAPLFVQNDPDGKPIKLESFRGKYVLIDFWASWCVPCREENPNVVKAYQRFKGKGFTVLGVSLDSQKSKASWIKAIQADHLTWTHVSDLKSWGNAVAEQYAVHGIPQNFLVDPKGKIVAKNLKGNELEKKLEELL